MINPYDQQSVDMATGAVNNMLGQSVTFRVSTSGFTDYGVEKLTIFMTFPMQSKERKITQFNSSSLVLENLRTSEKDEIIEFPMGHLIVEEGGQLDTSKMAAETLNRDIIRPQTPTPGGSIAQYHRHTMTINQIYYFLQTVGAYPAAQSNTWTGTETEKNSGVESNMTFFSTYRYLRMPKQDAIEYLNNIKIGYFDLPKTTLKSDLYYSKYRVYHMRPLYVPIRGQSITQPNSPGRFMYIYDCIVSWLRMHNQTRIDIIETGSNFGSGYMYWFKRLGPKDKSSDINYFELDSFSDFSQDPATEPRDKLRTLSEFFSIIGRGITIKSDSQDELVDYLRVRNSWYDPLAQYMDLYETVSAAGKETVVQKALRVSNEDAKRQMLIDGDNYRSLGDWTPAWGNRPGGYRPAVPQPRSNAPAAQHQRSNAPAVPQPRSAGAPQSGRGTGTFYRGHDNQAPPPAYGRQQSPSGQRVQSPSGQRQQPYGQRVQSPSGQRQQPYRRGGKR
jgi:hypothetical protein